MKIKTLLLATLLIGVLFSVQAQIPTNGLVAYYPFNNNANDVSGNNNNGNVSGAVLTNDRFGINNSAYSFNGQNSYISISNTFFNNGWQNYTISGWFSCQDVTKLYQTIYNTKPHNGIDLNLNHGQSRNNLSLWVNSSPNLISWDISASRGGTKNNYQNNTWYHFVFQKSGNTYKLYVNGIIDNSFTTTINQISYLCGFYLGATSANTENFFGKIDDIRIYDRTLDSNEIKLLYNESNCKLTAKISDNQKLVCPENDVTLTATNNGSNKATYLWDNGSTTKSITITPQISNKPYKVTVTDTNKCIANDSIYIYPKTIAPPSITLKGDSLISDIAYTYQWYNSKGMLNGENKRGYKPTATDDYSVMVTDSIGCKARSSNYSFIWVGINNQIVSNNTFISPNPAQNYIIINEKLKVESYKVFDITGNEVISGISNNINIAHLEKGIYIIRIITKENKTFNSKLIKE